AAADYSPGKGGGQRRERRAERGSERRPRGDAPAAHRRDSARKPTAEKPRFGSDKPKFGKDKPQLAGDKPRARKSLTGSKAAGKDKGKPKR
ncbi:MAG: hypothetical protein ACK4RS_03175, partial [Thiothrix sp.]